MSKCKDEVSFAPVVLINLPELLTPFVSINPKKSTIESLLQFLWLGCAKALQETVHSYRPQRGRSVKEIPAGKLGSSATESEALRPCGGHAWCPGVSEDEVQRR